MIDEMGRFPAENVLGPFGEHTLEAHGGNLGTDFIAVDERGVAEHLWCLAKEFLNLIAHT